MQIVTVNLPSVYIDAIATLTKKGQYPSRSEAIRVALRQFLKDELEMVEVLLEIKEENNKKGIITKGKKTNNKIDMRSIRSGWS
ncbi:MAG: ribbon-helix-helix domain-containing protein [Candidatus Helarchaeales archaeon]